MNESKYISILEGDKKDPESDEIKRGTGDAFHRIFLIKESAKDITDILHNKRVWSDHMGRHVIGILGANGVVINGDISGTEQKDQTMSSDTIINKKIVSSLVTRI